MAQLTDEDRVRYERDWANHSIRRNSEWRDLWSTMLYTSRMHVYADKVLVAWWLPDDAEQPEILNAFHVTGIKLDFDAGLQIVLRDRENLGVLVDSRPSKLPGLDVFLWTPAFSELRWVPTDWKKAGSPRILRVGLNFKQQRNLSGGPMPGTQYLTEVPAFRAQFPHLADMRF